MCKMIFEIEDEDIKVLNDRLISIGYENVEYEWKDKIIDKYFRRIGKKSFRKSGERRS